MNKHYSQEIAVPIFRFLCKDEWHFGFHGEDGIFHFGLNISNKIKEIKYLIRIHESEYTAYGICPKHADPNNQEMMQQMAFFLHRANYNLRNGNFELDIRDGEIRFKVHMDCEDLPAPTNAMVCNSIYLSAAIFKRYGDAIYYIIEDGMTAAEAIALSEGDNDTHILADDDDLIEIPDFEDEISEEFSSGEDPELPDFDESDDITDLFRMMQEMSEDD